MSTPHHRQNERRLERVAPKVEQPQSPPDGSLLGWAQEALHDHPLTALAIAAGLGFALGQGRATRALIRPLFSAGMRMAVPAMLAPLAAAILRQVSPTTDEPDPAPTKENRR